MSNTEDKEPPLCAKEVAALLGTSPRTAQRLMCSGAIASFRVGPGNWLIRTTAKAVDAYIAGQQGVTWRRTGCKRTFAEQRP
jgi:excisionase family DNA binding protein